MGGKTYFPLKIILDPKFCLRGPFTLPGLNATLHLHSVVLNIFVRPNGFDCLDPGDVTEAPVSWGPAAYTLHPPAPRLPGLQAHAPILPAEGRGPGILTILTPRTLNIKL